MTRHEELLSRILLETLPARSLAEGVRQLAAAGLLDRRACERVGIRREVERLAGRGVPRCEALHRAAALFSCSYEKARQLYYTDQKTRT